MNRMTIIPQLHFGRNKHGQECWNLTHYDAKLAVCLEIRYYHGDEDGTLNHYNVMAAIDADTGACGYREVMTLDEMKARFLIIEENEDEDAANAWLENMEDDYLLVSPAGGRLEILEIADSLKQRWEAMLTLNLFTPNINN